MKKYPYQLRTKVSENDLQIIMLNAEKAGLSICAYLREIATRKQIKSTIEISAVNVLNKIGAMVKLMMRDDRDLAPEILETLISLREAIESNHENQKN